MWYLFWKSGTNNWSLCYEDRLSFSNSSIESVLSAFESDESQEFIKLPRNPLINLTYYSDRAQPIGELFMMPSFNFGYRIVELSFMLP
jgi:hypothetical protein